VGALFILDEVMTGFRLAPGGAQELYSLSPDLTCLGKIVGGGLPVGAYGGRAEIMNHVAPVGPVYQAGTLSGNPLAMAAGCAALDALRAPGIYETLESRSARLGEGIQAAAREAGIPLTVNRVGSMWTAFFCPGPVTDYASAKTSDLKAFGRFFHSLLEQGQYIPPAQFEAAFVSLAHSEADIDETVDACQRAFHDL
jgi:glutamate-1-semialdehyde 2,1-aminomutase